VAVIAVWFVDIIR